MLNYNEEQSEIIIQRKIAREGLEQLFDSVSLPSSEITPSFKIATISLFKEGKDEFVLSTGFFDDNQTTRKVS